ncbi:SDR family oxidoreductase [Niallia endozanthoxylica]|uniref:SDR family oxidoreductase n=1 Tax=Niallia endozanthoxylica TaxID=2036016 RepID=A0A5J5I496_9BACI|nr:SDR family oxidoreductase [Niallia endozanthoxylica]KAA9028474.1 SDR family oxidoreductase [Niallia endozanthoxylica]
MTLSGKTAIVTGASSGIGEAAAFGLANAGANVVLAARRTERLEELKVKIEKETNAKALVVKTDVTDKAEMEILAEKTKEAFGSIDILVNNAGVMLLSHIKNDLIDEWVRMVDVNIKGVLHGIHAVLPTMLEQNTGHIINISSVAGHEVTRTSTVYSATKYAVRALSMGLEKEFSTTGLRVTNISPGAVESELREHITDEEVRANLGNKKRTLLQADDIANAIVYAVSQPPYVNVNEIIVRPKLNY